MRIHDQVEVNAPIEAVYTTLADPRFFVSQIPGARDLTRIDDTHYSAAFDLTVAMVRRSFDLAIEFVHLVPPNEIAADIRGAPLGKVLGIDARWECQLRDNGQRTQVEYLIDWNMTGALGPIGEKVLQTQAARIERDIRQAFAAR